MVLGANRKELTSWRKVSGGRELYDFLCQNHWEPTGETLAKVLHWDQGTLLPWKKGLFLTEQKVFKAVSNCAPSHYMFYLLFPPFLWFCIFARTICKLFYSLTFFFIKVILWSLEEGMRRERRGEKMSHFHFLPKFFYFGDLYYEWHGEGGTWKEIYIFLLNSRKQKFLFKESYVVRGDWECVL